MLTLVKLSRWNITLSLPPDMPYQQYNLEEVSLLASDDPKCFKLSEPVLRLCGESTENA